MDTECGIRNNGVPAYVKVKRNWATEVKGLALFREICKFSFFFLFFSFFFFFFLFFSFFFLLFKEKSVIIHVRGDRPTLLLDNDTILIDSNVLVGTTHIEIMNVSNTSIFATTYFIEVINNSK